MPPCGALRGDVGVDQFLPIADAGKNVRRHVQGMGRRGRDLGITPGGFEALVGDRRIIVEMDQIVRHAGMLRLALGNDFQDAAPLSWLA